MKKVTVPAIAVILFLQFLFTTDCKAQYFTIPDPTFAMWMNTHGLSGCLNGNQLDTTCLALLNVYALYLENTGIYDITGVKYFRQLQGLYLDHDSLTFLPELPDQLTALCIQHNLFTTIPSFPSLPLLTVFDCTGNQLTTLPPLPSNLVQLWCTSNQLISLPPLPAGLNKLFISYNNFTSLPTLPAGLTVLGCDHNNLTSLPAMPPALNTISFMDNQITVLPQMPNNLYSLHCDWNLLTNSSFPFPLPTNLSLFGCSMNQISILPPLPPNLVTLSCGYNPITALPQFPASLRDLYCQNTQVSSIPELNDTMGWVWCQNNYNLHCLPELKTIQQLNFTMTSVTCVPGYGSVNNSSPPLGLMPLCDLFNNVSNCPIYWNITGQVYYDANSNCVYDAGDLPQRNVNVKLWNGSTLVQQNFTTSSGHYSFNTDSFSTYHMTIDTAGLPFYVTCPLSGIDTSIISVVDSFDTGKDFGLSCEPGFDVGTTGVARTAGFMFPGNYFRLAILAGDISNYFGAHCASGTSGSVACTFNGPITYVNYVPGSIPPSSVIGNTITWTVPDFGTINFGSDFHVLFFTDTTAQLGQPACFTVAVTPVAGDNDVLNNFRIFCGYVSNSCDPNEKEVYPRGDILASQDWLTYTIHFQNTGNAAAQHIYLLDTLDSHLDISSIQLLSYSYEPITQVLEGGILRFNFPNINLPDSANNPEGSSGYVQYRIRLNPGLQPGTQITNTAYIIFDFNPAIVTNTTLNTIVNPTEIIENKTRFINIFIFPNPATDELRIESVDFRIESIDIYDLLGEKVFHRSPSGENKMVLDVRTLPSGIYFVAIGDEKNNLMVRKIVKM